MLHAVTTGAYYPPVDTTWKILTTGASQLTAGALCSGGAQNVSMTTIWFVLNFDNLNHVDSLVSAPFASTEQQEEALCCL